MSKKKMTSTGIKNRFFNFENGLTISHLCILSFLLTIVSMLFVYALKDVYPFGDGMYLRSDCYHQYAPYLDILQEKLRNGGSLLYTWNIGAGMNFIAIAAYYVANPLNLLTLIWPLKISDFVSFCILLKMGLAAMSTTYYLVKRFGKNNVSTVAFGMAYGLSAYFAAFSWNIMWLDCMWLLPFIVLGIDRLVNERKCKTYCIALALGIFSNYYIGIMLCIFSVLYFLYLFCTADIDTTAGKVKSRLLILKDYALFSLLSGTLAACVILPEYFNLLTTRSADTSFPSSLTSYFSFLYMGFRSLMAVPVADLNYAYDPNIYCGVAILFLIPLFLMCKKIKAKDRVGKFILMIILLLSFMFNIPNYIWHGFHFPNSLPCRESFIYIFLVLIMGYEAFLHIRTIKASKICASLGIGAGFVLLCEILFEEAEVFSDLDVDTSLLKIVWLTLLFMAIYAVLIYFYRTRPHLKSFLSYLMILTVFCELTLNMDITGIVSTSDKDSYYEAVETYDELNEQIASYAEQNGVVFYRTEKASHDTRNDGARFNYNSISTFSSVSSAAMQTYYDDMGLQTSYNAYSYLGHTPLTASLFSIRYEYSTTGESSLPDATTLIFSETYGNTSYTDLDGNTSVGQTISVYEYENTLPLGFMIKASTMTNWVITSSNPFATQNSFVVNAAEGAQTVFHKLKSGNTIGEFTVEYDLDDDDTYIITGDEDSFDVYFYCVTSAETLSVEISGSQSTTKTFSSTNQNYICHIGDLQKGDTVTVTSGDGQAISSCSAYAFDYDAWDVDYLLLSESTYEVDTWTDTKISGTINVSSSGMMYTSIPYDEGWSVYVDGVKTVTTAICDEALTGVVLTAGEHTVEFRYCPQGFVAGVIITVVSLVILLCVIFKSQLMGLYETLKSRKRLPDNGQNKK